MLKKFLLGVAVAMAVTILPAQAMADPITFTAILTGSQENPPNSSLALGLGRLVLNDAHTAGILSLQWAGLSSNAVFAQVFLFPDPAGENARLINIFQGPSSFGTNGLLNIEWVFQPVSTRGGRFVLSVQDQIDAMFAGNIYIEIFTGAFPAGEVRGHLQQDCSAVPEPMTMVLLGTGLVGVAARVRKRPRANRGLAS